MATPRPGKPARGSTTGRPIMVLLDLLGRRWCLRIIWELRHGPLSFRALRAACDDVSPSILNRRLAELRESGIVALGETGYALTRAGRELRETLGPLHRWAESWAKRMA